ncbi:MAG: PhzF family phenazine biosynthesis protein [Gammaproteobacteria bacterium]|nr:PhzF family phenazine biosynthesis protein [Gammaproteobacteria bacterium]
MKITHLSCFATEISGSGNPAAVIEDFMGDDAAKQALATELDLPVTVFIEPHNTQIRLRYFYPATEMSMCNHGTLAAAAVLLRDRAEQEIEFTNRENRSIRVKRAGDEYFQEFGPAEVLPIRVNAAEIETLLNLPDKYIDHNLPCVVSSVGSPKLLVPVKTMADLGYLEPNFEAIKSWSLSHNVNGVYVYTLDGDECDFYARAFNPKTGNNEDAATGVAAGPLLGAMGGNITLRIGQGRWIGRPSVILASIYGGSISVGGRVEFAN